MALIKMQNFSFAYPGDEGRALSEINLSVEQGEFVVLCGPSGSGKTTLLRNLKKEISPVGKNTGSITYKGIPFSELQDELSAKEIGMVFQDPENQIVMDTVIHELAFSLENFGCKPDVIKKNIAEMVTFFGLEDCLYKPVHELSGGQKQIMNLCSVLLLKPRLLLLDEPTSQLDPVSAHEFIKMVYQLNQEFSITVIISEHRLEQVFPIADRVVYMDNGYIKYLGTPKEISKYIIDQNDLETVQFLPSVTRLFFHTHEKEVSNWADSIPLTIREGKQFMKKVADRIQNITDDSNINESTCGKGDNDPDESDKILECSDISFRYDKENPLVLKKLSLSVKKGDFLAVLGGNGAGKTTLLQMIAGLIKPRCGNVYFKGTKIERIEQKERYCKIGYVAQNPLLHFTFDTVDAELQFAVQRAGKAHSGEKLKEMIALFDLDSILSRHPYDCSGGQQQKLALACTLIPEPELLLIDEPTKGLDAVSKDRLARLLEELRHNNLTIVMVTHDIEFAANHAKKCAMLFDGSITTCADPTAFFSGNYFYTTAINRAARDYLPNAVTCKDVMQACNIPERE